MLGNPTRLWSDSMHSSTSKLFSLVQGCWQQSSNQEQLIPNGLASYLSDCLAMRFFPTNKINFLPCSRLQHGGGRVKWLTVSTGCCIIPVPRSRATSLFPQLDQREQLPRRLFIRLHEPIIPLCYVNQTPYRQCFLSGKLRAFFIITSDSFVAA